jgi:hypothetical protein
MCPGTPESTGGSDRLPGGVLPGKPQAVQQKLTCMSNTVKSRYKWRYDRARDLEANLNRGIKALGEIARAISGAARGPQ